MLLLSVAKPGYCTPISPGTCSFNQSKRTHGKQIRREGMEREQRESLCEPSSLYPPSPTPEQQQMTIAAKTGHGRHTDKSRLPPEPAEVLHPNKHSHREGARVEDECGHGNDRTNSKMTAQEEGSVLLA